MPSTNPDTNSRKIRYWVETKDHRIGFITVFDDYVIESSSTVLDLVGLPWHRVLVRLKDLLQQ